MKQPQASAYYVEQLQQALFTLNRITDEHFGLYLAQLLTSHSFADSQQQLRQLEGMFSTFTVATRGFRLDIHWNHQQPPTPVPSRNLELKVEEVALRLNISKPKVYRYIRSGKLPARNHGSKAKPCYRVNEADLTKFNPNP